LTVSGCVDRVEERSQRVEIVVARVNDDEKPIMRLRQRSGVVPVIREHEQHCSLPKGKGFLDDVDGVREDDVRIRYGRESTRVMDRDKESLQGGVEDLELPGKRKTESQQGDSSKIVSRERHDLA
jgi:hypothetical protein